MSETLLLEQQGIPLFGGQCGNSQQQALSQLIVNSRGRWFRRCIQGQGAVVGTSPVIHQPVAGDLVEPGAKSRPRLVIRCALHHGSPGILGQFLHDVPA